MTNQHSTCLKEPVPTPVSITPRLRPGLIIGAASSKESILETREPKILHTYSDHHHYQRTYCTPRCAFVENQTTWRNPFCRKLGRHAHSLHVRLSVSPDDICGLVQHSMELD